MPYVRSPARGAGWWQVSPKPKGDPKTAVTIDFPMTLPSVANARLHWAAKARLVKSQRASTTLMLHANQVGQQLRIVRKGERLRVLLVRVGPRKLDDDNLSSAFKAVRDSVAAYFGIDDGDERIKFNYGQDTGRAMVQMVFSIEPLPMTPREAREYIATANEANDVVAENIKALFSEGRT